jgi:hypothetical protein
VVVLWRPGLRISEALALTESGLDATRGAGLSAAAKGASAAKSGWTGNDCYSANPEAPSVTGRRSSILEGEPVGNPDDGKHALHLCRGPTEDEHPAFIVSRFSGCQQRAYPGTVNKVQLA